MKIHLKDLTPEVNVEILGKEPWLERIYADFLQPEGEKRPEITGALTVIQEEAGSVQVRGRLAYEPYVECSRCSMPVAYAIKCPVSVRYLPADYNKAEKDKNLSAAELDAYFIQNEEIDLEELVNDLIQTAIPARVIHRNEDGSFCLGGHEDDEADERLYGPGKDEAASPFAALKGLKLRQ